MQCLASKVHTIKQLEDYYGYRSETYNLPQSTLVKIKPDGRVETAREAALADYTDSMNAFLHRVNTKRTATLDEKKIALQVMFSNSIIKEGKGKDYQTNPYTASDKDPLKLRLFRHFEALRYAENLCNWYVLQMLGIEDKEGKIGLYRNRLKNFSKIDPEMFDLWFAETLQQHGIGFVVVVAQTATKSESIKIGKEEYISNGKEIFLTALARAYMRHEETIEKQIKPIPRKKFKESMAIFIRNLKKFPNFIQFLINANAAELKEKEAELKEKETALVAHTSSYLEELRSNPILSPTSTDLLEEGTFIGPEFKVLTGDIIVVEKALTLSLKELNKQLKAENEIIETLITITLNQEEKRKFNDKKKIKETKTGKEKEIPSALDILNNSKLEHQKHANRLKKIIQLKKANPLEIERDNLEKRKEELEQAIAELRELLHKSEEGPIIPTSDLSVKEEKKTSFNPKVTAYGITTEEVKSKYHETTKRSRTFDLKVTEMAPKRSK